MGRATSKGNEAKRKMKHPSDIVRPAFYRSGFGAGAIDLWPIALPVTPRRQEVQHLQRSSIAKIKLAYIPIRKTITLGGRAEAN